jgi:MFS family permease
VIAADATKVDVAATSSTPTPSEPPTGRVRWLRHTTASFAHPQFRRVWLGAVLFSLGQWMERIAVGWFVFELTGSVFLTAVAWSVRMAPSMVMGPIAGAASDRLPRHYLLAGATAIKAAVLIVLGVLVVAGVDNVPLLMLLFAVSGTAMTFNITALQALAADVVGPERMANAVSLTSFGQRSVGAVGAIASGLLFEAVGPGRTFLLATIPLALAVWVYLSVRVERRGVIAASGGFRGEVFEGLRLITAVPMVGLLLGLMVLVEILGFSFNSILPVVAAQVLEVGPEGLGTLASGAAVGSMLGTALLAATSHLPRRGLMLLTAVALFGVLIMLLGASTTFVLSLLVVAGIGAMAAMVDALEWIMLQASVPDRLRGRALGGWNLAIGLGWVGPIILGAVADLAGVRWALMLFGLLLIAVAAGTAAVAHPLRRA